MTYEVLSLQYNNFFKFFVAVASCVIVLLLISFELGILSTGCYLDYPACFLKSSQVYLCRNTLGDIDCKGKVWAAPYRWGTMVIAYKKSKFKELNMDPIEVTSVIYSFLINVLLQFCCNCRRITTK